MIVNFRAAISSFYNQFSCTDAENVNLQGSPLSHCFGLIGGTVCRGGSRVVQVICKIFFQNSCLSSLIQFTKSISPLVYCLLLKKKQKRKYAVDHTANPAPPERIERVSICSVSSFADTSKNNAKKITIQHTKTIKKTSLVQWP